MISNIDIKRFTQLFRGKTNTYVKNELPKEKPEAGQKIKTKITNNEGKVDEDLLSNHLEGKFGVGICPVSAEGKCYFGVLDIDYYKSRRYVYGFSALKYGKVTDEPNPSALSCLGNISTLFFP